MNANPLQAEIARAKQLETVALFERNEARIAENLPRPMLPLSDEDKQTLLPFAQWCQRERVRYCPAKPTTVAAYLADHVHRGERVAIDAAQAIERLHDVHGLSNPVATAVVRQALEAIIHTDPPRSWRKDEKVAFAMLPPLAQAAIARRETDRERELRRIQNEAKRQTGNAAESAESKENGNG